MKLTASDLTFLTAALACGVERRGQTWHAGAVEADRRQIGRLVRGGYLSGKRRAMTLTVSAVGKRTLAPMDLPPVGVEVTFRSSSYEGPNRQRRYLRGRVLAYLDRGWKRSVLVVPVGKPLALYEISRPHRGAGWKGHRAAIGMYRGEPVWREIEAAGLVPASFYAEYKAQVHTIARLREVAERLRSIGTHTLLTVEERVASWGQGLEHFRSRLTESRMPVEERAYLEAVLVKDAMLIEMAEWAHVQQAVRMVGCMEWRSLWEPVTVPTLDEVKQTLRRLRPDLVERAYAECLPRWQEYKAQRDAHLAKLAGR